MLKYVIWDKATAVNGVEPEEFARHHGIRDQDQVYLIYKGDRAMCVQTDANSPYAGEGKAIEDMAQEHLEMLAQVFGKE